MFVQKQFQVEIESTKQLPRIANTPIDYTILNKKFLKVQGQIIRWLVPHHL